MIPNARPESQRRVRGELHRHGGEEAWWQKLGLDPSNGTGRITDNERLGKTFQDGGKRRAVITASA